MNPTAIRLREERRAVALAGALGVSLLLGLAFVPRSAAAQQKASALTGLTLAPSKDGFTAVVETDGIIDHRIYIVVEPPQVVVDILDVGNTLVGLRPSVSHPLLLQVQSQQFSMVAYDQAARGRSFARITFELKKPVWHSLTVKPGQLELGIHQKTAEGAPAANVVVREEPGPPPESVIEQLEPGPKVTPEPSLDPRPSTKAGFSPMQWIEPADVSADVFFGTRTSGQDQYVIGPNDMLEVRVFELDQLNRTLRVEADGTVILPLIGPVQVAGHTAPQMAEAIAKKLRGEYVDDPQVSVLITEYQSRRVSFLGAVARPGTYPLIGQRHLLELIATAEGLATGAGSVLYVFRKLPDGRSARLSVPLNQLLVMGDPKWNIQLQPGDVVSVPPEDAISVSVVGSVGRPGVYKLPAGKGATLLRAIALAGGLGSRASKGIQVKRQSPAGDETVLKVDLGAVMSGKDPDFVLQEGDVVIVNQSFF